MAIVIGDWGLGFGIAIGEWDWRLGIGIGDKDLGLGLGIWIVIRSAMSIKQTNLQNQICQTQIKNISSYNRKTK